MARGLGWVKKSRAPACDVLFVQIDFTSKFGIVFVGVLKLKVKESPGQLAMPVSLI